MPSTISTQPRAPVEVEPRRHLTEAEKLSRWEACNRCCTICGEPVEATGPTVIWDHRIPLDLGGSNDLSNFEPNHNTPACSGKKTRADQLAIAKARRLRAKHDPLREPSRHFGGWKRARRPA